MRALRLTFLILTLLLALAVAAQNTGVVRLHLLLWQVEMSVFVLLALTLGTGFILGLAAGVIMRVSRAARRK